MWARSGSAAGDARQGGPPRLASRDNRPSDAVPDHAADRGLPNAMFDPMRTCRAAVPPGRTCKPSFGGPTGLGKRGHGRGACVRWRAGRVPPSRNQGACRDRDCRRTRVAGSPPHWLAFQPRDTPGRSGHDKPARGFAAASGRAQPIPSAPDADWRRSVIIEEPGARSTQLRTLSAEDETALFGFAR